MSTVEDLLNYIYNFLDERTGATPASNQDLQPPGTKSNVARFERSFQV